MAFLCLDNPTTTLQWSTNVGRPSFQLKQKGLDQYSSLSPTDIPRGSQHPTIPLHSCHQSVDPHRSVGIHAHILISHTPAQHTKSQAVFLTAIATFSKNLFEDISIQDWSTFVHKNYSILYNNFPSSSIHNSPRRCSNLSRPVKILTPFERQWLLEGKAFLATMMRAAWKADQWCPNNYHATAQHKSLLITSPTFSYKSYRSQQQQWISHLERHLREKLNLLACTLRCKTKRSDSEAWTIGSNKRLRKPD